MSFRINYCYSIAIFLVLVECWIALPAQAEVENPSDDYVFSEDRRDYKLAKKKMAKAVLQSDKPNSQDLDFKAPDVQFDQEKKIFYGTGGVVVSQFGVQVQGDQGSYATQTKEAELSGGIYFNSQDLSISASKSKFNLENETGVFSDADVLFEDGGYRVKCQELNKIAEFDYTLDSADFTTCGCQDRSRPWSFHSSSGTITEEGYAHLRNVTFNVHDIPIFYTPYLVLPAKRERASGLLFPEIGYSSEDGFQYKQPVFVVIDDNSDLLISPFTEAKTRNGSELEFRKLFSKKSSLQTRFVYSDESPRDDDLRGSNVSGLNDPTFDQDRFGGYYVQRWKSDKDAALPLSFIADGHYVSDDLFLRELDQDKIGMASDRYVTSTAVLSAPLGDYMSADLSAEFNQALQSDDDLVFQRLPEVTLSGLRSFRVFGVNPYGAKLVTKGNFTATQFARDQGFDGLRANFNPGVKVPLHFKNYVTTEIRGGANQTLYSLDDTVDPETGAELDDSNDRLVPDLGFTSSTALERVFDLDPDGWLPYVAAIGSRSQSERLTRVKHVVEPYFGYTFIPDVSQDQLPLFDSKDRIREKSLFALGIRTSLLGRFDPVDQGKGVISELTPRVEDLPTLAFDRPLSDVGDTEIFTDEFGGAYSQRRAPVRELVALTIKQTYDYKEDVEDNDSDRRPWSDLGSQLDMFANDYFAMRFDSNLDTQETQMSSWGLGWHLRDDRGDAMFARYSYLDNEISQTQGNLELALTPRFKLGYYGNYDHIEGELIESRVGMRYSGSCNCWRVDLGYHEMINPDKEKFLLTFTLAGLGHIKF